MKKWKKNVSNIVLYACLFEITCITPSGKEHDPLDDKKNMNTSYTMYTLKSKLLKKHTLLHLNIICISTWMVTQKNSIINSMYLYVAYNCIPLTRLVTVTKLHHSNRVTLYEWRTVRSRNYQCDVPYEFIHIYWL